MNTYVTDMDKAPAVREVRAKYFGEATPASTLVQVVKLARPEFMLEIEVIAALLQSNKSIMLNLEELRRRSVEVPPTAATL